MPLGTISVDLVANIAKFVTDMGTASSHAKKFGAEVTESFSRIGETAGRALAPFGEIGRAIGETFSQIGSLGGAAAQTIGEMSGGMTVLASAAGIAAGGIAAVNIASIGLAIHTAESVREMNDQARSVGVSIDRFSALSFAAKQAGVPQEALVKILGVLSKNMLKAAETAPGTATAFSRMGLSVKDSNGHLKDAGEFLTEVVQKLDSMNDRTAAVGSARTIAGKSGQELLKFDPDEMADSIDVAKKLGLVIGPEFAEASTKFVQSMNVIKAAGEGVALKLTEKLLPALQLVADEIIKALENNGPAIESFVEKIAWLTKQSIAHVYEFITMARDAGKFLDAIQADAKQFGETTGDVIAATAAAITNPQAGIKGIVDANKQGSDKLRAIWQKYDEDSKKLWKDNHDFIENLTGPRAPWTLKHEKDRSDRDIDLKPEKDDTILERIKERIDALAKEAAGWLKIGEAGSQAEQLIAEAQKKGTDEFEKLRDMASREQNPARRTAALSFVDANQSNIEGAEAATVYGAAIKGIVSELDKQHLKLQEEAAAAQSLSDAYGTAGLAAAIINAHFADQSAKVVVLKQAHDLLAAKLGEENAEVKQLAEGYALASKELDVDKIAYAAKVHAELHLKIREATDAFEQELPALRAIGDAYFDTAEAARAAQVELKVAQFKAANPLAGPDDIKAQRDLETQRSKEAFQNSIKEQAAKLDLIHTYDEEIKRLAIVREMLQQKGKTTLLVDAEEYDFQRRIIQQWDAAVSKVGTFSQRMKGLFNELALEGQNFSGKMFESFHKAINDVETQLAKLVVTGKANFKEILQSMEESIVKAGIQKGVGAIAGAIGLNIPGLGAKADGSSSNPFYVKNVDAGVGGLLGAGGGQPNGGFLSGLFGGGGSSGGGFFSTLLGGLGFGGFLEGGGDVAPGKAYVVGEKHPEFFVPKQAGQVAPSLSVGRSTNHTSIVHMHIHGVSDFDSFKRSQGQIMAGMQRQIAIAHARNS